MFCVECSTQLNDDAKFCSGCGKKCIQNETTEDIKKKILKDLIPKKEEKISVDDVVYKLKKQSAKQIEHLNRAREIRKQNSIARKEEKKKQSQQSQQSQQIIEEAQQPPQRKFIPLF